MIGSKLPSTDGTPRSGRCSYGGHAREPFHPLPGAVRLESGDVEWRVWAPLHDVVDLILIDSERDQRRTMLRRDDYFVLRLNGITDGARYRYSTRVGEFPDPASRWQPDGIWGASAVYSPSRFSWTDQGWRGISREDLVLYELHVGTFTPEGTFDAVIPRLGELQELGITAIELMPVAQFPGERNWGYDGVFPFAVQNSYGGPDALQRLVDAAHRAHIAVFLDVVYNHLGPEGNIVTRFAPYFTSAYRTPWGDALNFDGPDSDGVRNFIIENACMWVRDYHVDGLRLDAVHAIYDFGARHILAELQAAVQNVARVQDRIVHVIAESDLNDPRLIDPVSMHGFGLDAVWADELHHSLWSMLTHDSVGYLAQFGEAWQLAKAYESVFVHDGIYSAFRRRKFGAPVGGRDRTRFVVSINNHDQIGNRPFGDRPATYLSAAAQRLACGLLLLSPCTPLLFMGEEYGETRPFPYFCSFEDPRLVESVCAGRRADFPAATYDLELMPDPQSDETCRKAVLTWEWTDSLPSGQMRRLYRELLQMRSSSRQLRDRAHCRCRLLGDENQPILEIKRGKVSPLIALANLAPAAVELPAEWRSPQHLTFSTEDVRFGGSRRRDEAVHQLESYELLVLRYDD
jgi:maltooligosyltrehalose trehalohydrolase